MNEMMHVKHLVKAISFCHSLCFQELTTEETELRKGKGP